MKNVFAHLYARAGIVDDDGISHTHLKCGHKRIETLLISDFFFPFQNTAFGS